MTNDSQIKTTAHCLMNSSCVLSHYTKFNSALLILKSKKFKFSNPLKVNDICESSRTVYVDYAEIKKRRGFYRYEEVVKTIRHFRQISLTRDGDRRCFDIPAMWGHYADKGKGACILFNKDILLSGLDHSFWRDRINYQDYSSQHIRIQKNDDILSEIESIKKEVFFEKTRDWSYEQEFRIVKFFEDKGDHYFDIPDGSILGIVIYRNIPTNRSSSKGDDRIRQIQEAAEVPIFYYDNRFLEESADLLYYESSDLISLSNIISYLPR